MKTAVQELCGKESDLIHESIKYKLEHLNEYMPGESVILYDFAKLLSELAGRSSNELSLSGFNIMVELAIYNLENKIDAFSDKDIQAKIFKYSLKKYEILIKHIPRIEKMIFGKKDGNESDDIRDTVKFKHNKILKKQK